MLVAHAKVLFETIIVSKETEYTIILTPTHETCSKLLRVKCRLQHQHIVREELSWILAIYELLTGNMMPTLIDAESILKHAPQYLNAPKCANLLELLILSCKYSLEYLFARINFTVVLSSKGRYLRIISPDNGLLRDTVYWCAFLDDSTPISEDAYTICITNWYHKHNGFRQRIARLIGLQEDEPSLFGLAKYIYTSSQVYEVCHQIADIDKLLLYGVVSVRHRSCANLSSLSSCVHNLLC